MGIGFELFREREREGERNWVLCFRERKSTLESERVGGL